MQRYVVVLLMLTLAVYECNCKVYGKCEFAKTMKYNGIKSIADLGTWTCIAFHESRFDTNAINHVTGDYGILQISHYFWCSDSNVPGKGCHITCQSLLNDDITSDIVCAKKIFNETKNGPKKNGFAAWTTYSKYCTGDQRSWVSGCGL
ncbi:hypothetical protein GWI33_020037 [Rhynchophorus ferrugineus]|uniref:lysozyme n=1 Tax=Rhynchophorus ferrugineus TaxID=354439 RepID=A0A834HT65_RHYFE|nr:hypothetical protein GWI33_020037 [Rhynchophorus ferrugineus]